MIRRRFGPASDDGSGSDASSASSWITRGRPAGRAGTHVKDGDGAVLRCVNARTGKTSGVLLWDVGAAGASGAGVGCWNPSEYAAADDFRVGDVLDFPDLAAPPLDLAPVQRVTFNTGTGWNLAGPHLAFGRCGVVGDWWRTLEAEFRMDEETRVVGVYTDAPSELPVAVYHLAEGEEERWVEARTRETATRGRVVVIEPAVKTRGVRVAWETTDLHKTGGLSTARSGGGVHAHILATTADRDEGGVMTAAARGARAAPPAAPSTVRTAPAGAATAEPGTGWRSRVGATVGSRRPERRDNPKITCRTSDGRTNDRDGSLGSETVIIRRAIERARSKSRWTRRASVIDDRLALEVALARATLKSLLVTVPRAPRPVAPRSERLRRVFRDVSARHPPAIHQRS